MAGQGAVASPAGFAVWVSGGGDLWEGVDGSWGTFGWFFGAFRRRWGICRGGVLLGEKNKRESDAT